MSEYLNSAYNTLSHYGQQALTVGKETFHSSLDRLKQIDYKSYQPELSRRNITSAVGLAAIAFVAIAIGKYDALTKGWELAQKGGSHLKDGWNWTRSKASSAASNVWNRIQPPKEQSFEDRLDAGIQEGQEGDEIVVYRTADNKLSLDASNTVAARVIVGNPAAPSLQDKVRALKADAELLFAAELLAKADSCPTDQFTHMVYQKGDDLTLVHGNNQSVARFTFDYAAGSVSTDAENIDETLLTRIQTAWTALRANHTQLV